MRRQLETPKRRQEYSIKTDHTEKDYDVGFDLSRLRLSDGGLTWTR